MNRKLVRPNLAEIKEKLTHSRVGPAHTGAPGNARDAGATPNARRRPAPPESTSAEAFYYLKQMNSKTPMVLVLDDGSRLRGHIEWYDRGCLKVHREDGPNVLVFKHAVRFLYKQEDEDRFGTPEGPGGH